MKINTMTTVPAFNAVCTRPRMAVSALSLAGVNPVFGDLGAFDISAAVDVRDAVTGSGRPAWSPPV